MKKELANYLNNNRYKNRPTKKNNMKENNKWKYQGDSRYEKIYEKMQLLGIQDVTTDRQHKNGTIVWKLPIKMNWPRNKDNKGYKCIEVASFSTGYVRNQNSGYSNYQLNKRCMNEPEYFKDYEYNDDYTKKKWTGKYRMFQTRACVLIPKEIDRLEYLLKYCVKNYYIKNANQVPDGDFYPKWMYEDAEKQGYSAGLQEKIDAKPAVENLSVTVNGEKYKII